MPRPSTPAADPPTGDTLARLAAVIAQRRGGDPATSYVAGLLAKGGDAVLKKIGEEATEVVMAAKDGDRPHIVAEMADLWFHCLIALELHGLQPADVLAELQRRAGISGLDEFAAREGHTRARSAAHTSAQTHADTRERPSSETTPS